MFHQTRCCMNLKKLQRWQIANLLSRSGKLLCVLTAKAGFLAEEKATYRPHLLISPKFLISDTFHSSKTMLKGNLQGLQFAKYSDQCLWPKSSQLPRSTNSQNEQKAVWLWKVLSFGGIRTHAWKQTGNFTLASTSRAARPNWLVFGHFT